MVKIQGRKYIVYKSGGISRGPPLYIILAGIVCVYVRLLLSDIPWAPSVYNLSWYCMCVRTFTPILLLLSVRGDIPWAPSVYNLSWYCMCVRTFTPILLLLVLVDPVSGLLLILPFVPRPSEIVTCSLGLFQGGEGRGGER